MEKTMELYALYATETAESRFIMPGIILTDEGKIPDDEWQKFKEKVEKMIAIHGKKVKKYRNTDCQK